MDLKLMKIVKEQYGIAELPEDPVSAMAYVPFQQEDSKTYTPDQGYMLGTMYQELNKPFFGSKCGDGND